MTYKFDQIAYNLTAKRKPTKEDMKTYIGLEHLVSGSLNVEEFGSDVEIKGEKLIMTKGDVLLGKRNAYLRRAAIAPHDGLFSAHGMILRPKEDVINKDYFPFFIASDIFFDEAIRISVGGLSPTINWKDLKELEFDLPSIEEQKVLADKLWAAYKVKESYRQLLSTTDEMLKAKFQEMFGDAEKNGTISDLVENNIASVKKTYKNEDTIAYIDISSVSAESNKVLDVTNYVVKQAPSRAQQCVRKGDILVSTTRPLNRNIAVVESDASNLVASTGFCVLRPKNGWSDYVMAIVKSDEYTEAMCDKATGGVYPAVNNSDVLSYNINIPSPEILQQISLIFRQAEATKASLRASIEAIDRVIRSLINQ